MTETISVPSISHSEGVLNSVADDKTVIDYTGVSAGLRIEGFLWTGQPTAFTARCPKCGRIGIASVPHNVKALWSIEGAQMLIGLRALTIVVFRFLRLRPPNND
jgi:hypothetical protein